MLRDSAALQPALAPVRMEHAWQRDGEHGEVRSTPFRLVTLHTDGHWQPAACATGMYRLLDNRLVVDAIERQGPRFGLNLEPARAFAHRGDGGQFVTAQMTGTRSRIVLTDESKRGAIKHAGTDVVPTVSFDNDYRPGMYGTFKTGTGHYICTNLMWWGGSVESSERLLHKGSRESGPFTPGEIEVFVERGLKAAALKIDKDRELIELLAVSKVDLVTLSASLIESVPERQRARLQEAIVRNTDLYGATGWGVVQAASEIVTHAWLRNGASAWSAQDWLGSALKQILEGAEIAA